MLSAIRYQLATELDERACPYPVEYGPERPTQTSQARTHIVVQRDRKRGDTFEGPWISQHNPKMDHVVWLGAEILIYASSGVEGAKVDDHERRADHIRDQIMISMRHIIQGRKTSWRVRSAGLMTAEALKERNLEAWPGVVYLLSCEIARGVTDANYAGTEATEVEAGTDYTTKTTLSTDGPGPSGGVPGATTR